MILPSSKDAVHKAWLYRLLSAIAEDSFLTGALYFKGGTCAAMRGLLDRFSIDLDFDLLARGDEAVKVRKNLEKIFLNLGLEIKDKSRNVPQYFLRYPAGAEERNTLKIDITTDPPESNKYEPVRLNDIDRIMNCQTVETMFANKLVALMDRFEKNNSIAGRDLYDIHYFFLRGFRYNDKVIAERRKTGIKQFFSSLISFVEKNISLTIIDQDLNVLLPYDKFIKIRKNLKSETLIFLKDELKRLGESKNLS
ncbi:MAG: nucleotidyl transferase AbiEii/AbiGii toxin family protein [Patescibacteria group bacterium]|jgi:predicted nucleotidyltransferase component of viral defense system